MMKILYRQCIYIAEKIRKKTNRCQKIKVKNQFKILLKTGFYGLDYSM